ncbi:DUF2254 domain-containing protein [Pontibacter liquoris]|uniref:DUF2254 domain-containing protein n=1 Tax=Pontibacter liquoris TaxID=2905677 RepID=UPI001FA78BC8|nr:DUF2254 domain-containing protein [Pontibacter liquoris]
MKGRLRKWIRQFYNNLVNSIAFYPAIIAICFLVLSYVLLYIDFSPLGKSIKSRWDFISLRDASTARTIAATIAAGVLSLTVFSFSMVMILLNQAASNLSNRVLDSMIGNRFQQWVLGFYIGTIVYALFLLSTIRDIDSGIMVPALSVYLLILFTIGDIFLFIYFLHYITQSVKYETIIRRIYQATMAELERQCQEKERTRALPGNPVSSSVMLFAPVSGYFQGFNKHGLLEVCRAQNWLLHFCYPAGTYLLRGTAFVAVEAAEELTQEQREQLHTYINFYDGEPIEKSAFYGFKQLVEVAVKALSPGINDPGTAVLSLHALADLLAFRLTHFPEAALSDDEGVLRIITSEYTFPEMFERCILPIWDYGKEDRLLRLQLQQVLQQLQALSSSELNASVIREMQQQVNAAIARHIA